MFFIKKIDLAVYATYSTLLLISAVNGWRPFKIVISNVTVETYSPKCRMNASVADSGLFNIYVEFLKPLGKPFMHTQVYFQSDDGRFDMTLLDHTVDLCMFYKNRRFKPLVQMILKLIEDHLTHWFKSCPVNKGIYYVKNVEFNVEMLPPIFPEKSGVFVSNVLDKQERLYRLQIFFQIIKTFKKKL